jgi:transcriptional regulator NrdR family protein
MLNNIYDISTKIKSTINDKINTLQKLSFAEIYKEFNIVPLFNRLDSFDLEDIMDYIYSDEIDKIDRNIPNYNICIKDTIIFVLEESKKIEYYTKKSIIEKFMNAITNDQIKMQELQTIVIDNIYNNYIMITSSENINEVKMKALYNTLQVNYVKICIPQSNKIKWIMNTLKTKYNVMIPEKYINNKLNNIFNIAKKINNNIFIEYDVDESDIIQKQTYLIDCLYHEIMKTI